MIHQVSQQHGTGRRVFLETFGCQMNELDSELVRGHLAALGYDFVPKSNEADIILYNTCSVREQAENKVYSRLGVLGVERKETGRRAIVGVIGCMAEREGAAMMRRFPQIDLMCGPGELDKLPMLLENVLATEAVELADRVALQGSNARRSTTLHAAEDNLELLDLSRAFDPDRAAAGGRSAYVRITRGCNKFCTYCVVPHTRGPEVHRAPDAIVEECRRLADQGVIEITLLGQTVNHYLYTHGLAVTVDGREMPQVGPGAKAFRRPDSLGGRTTTFADLLYRIHEEVPAIERLRFVTSYPRDFTDDALRVMAECPRICRYLHVPAQSGSNRILKLMNRGYTREEYLEFISRARHFMPDVSIAGDIIVGFPTETDEDFELTKSLLREVRFKNNFIFKYSPRPGTVAIDRFADDVPAEIKRKRNNELLELQGEISASVHREAIGRVVGVFVGQVSEVSRKRRASAEPGGAGTPLTIGGGIPGGSRASGTGQAAVAGEDRPRVQLSGRTEGDLITVFDLPDGMEPDALIGRIVPIEVIGAGPLLLRGRLAVSSPHPNAGAASREAGRNPPACSVNRSVL